MVEKQAHELDFGDLKNRIVTYTGKAGSGLISFSRELFKDALDKGLRVAYITDSVHMGSLLHLDEGFAPFEIEGFTMFPIHEEALEKYPKGYLYDSLNKLNPENFDVIFINATYLLSNAERGHLIETPQPLATVIFEQEHYAAETAEDVFSHIDPRIVRRSHKIIHLEKRTGFEFKTLKERYVEKTNS